MHRVAVIGTSCSGKTTLARRLAEAMGSPYIELDAIHWGPHWTERPPDHVRARVDEATRQVAWVTCGNDAFLRDILWQRADTIIWLNYSFPVIWSRAMRRTIRRSLAREELWAGNRESLTRALLSRESILLWILKTYWKHRREYAQILAQREHAHLTTREFTRPVQADVFLQSVTACVTSPTPATANSAGRADCR